MSVVKRIPLSKIEIIGDNPSFKKSIPTGMLVVIQEVIDDGFGGQLPGMRRWQVETAYMAAIPFTGETVKFTSGQFNGKCFLLNAPGDSMTFQGTGQLNGVDFSQL